MEENYETTKLKYDIYEYSSHSANYLPSNIMINKPLDQLSRWYTDNNTPQQFVMLKLKYPAVVETITFGKYKKPHVGDLKKFNVFGGIDDKNFSLLLSGGLRHDNTPETFKLRHLTKEGLNMPVRYLKIVPLQSWGPSHNSTYTIWYVELHGKVQEDFIRESLDTLDLLKEEEAVRIILKHLRRRAYRHTFEALSRESGVRLEGPLQSRLWNALVENGDYELVERIFKEAEEGGELSWHVSCSKYRARWRALSACSAEVEDRLSAAEAAPPPYRPRHHDAATHDCDLRPDTTEASPTSEIPDLCETGPGDGGTAGARPGPRGGHQLVLDPTTGNLYLFGGWSGTSDLDDLWRYDVSSSRWSLLCPRSGLAGGPGPRSCHKMVLDPQLQKLYTLGRYLDNSQRLPENLKSDFYVFDIATNEWSLECSDTAAVGGPKLVFDHQMCIDADTHTIYVFGGRMLPSNTEESLTPNYSGLFSYCCTTNTWTEMPLSPPAPLPRQGHSMIFHPAERRLYIFGGQRNKVHLAEVWRGEVGGAGDAVGGAGDEGAGSRWTGWAGPPPPAPAPGFTQRATLQPDTGECFLLSGMSKERDRRVHNSLWVVSLVHRTCYCLYRNEQVCADEPRPRFAHQLVYDADRKVHYLFGGNPGVSGAPRLRLDDLWALTLHKPTTSDLLRKAVADIRHAHYSELAAAAAEEPELAPAALQYLRDKVYHAIDKDNKQEVMQYQRLAVALFRRRDRFEPALVSMDSKWRDRLAQRVASTRDQGNLADHLNAILGGEECGPTQPHFTEQPVSDAPSDTCDVWGAPDASPAPDAWDRRAHRVALYDTLCKYFPEPRVHPQPDVTDLVSL